MQTKKKNGFLKKLHKYRVYLLMLSPAVIYTLIFAYYPMTGVVMAFKKYNYAGGIWGSPWNGLDNFAFFFKSGQAGLVTRNTVLYNLAFILIGTFVQVAVAVFLTEIRGKRFRKVSQSMMFLPYFISWVIVGTFVLNLFNYETGVMNSLVRALGGEPINLYTSEMAWAWVIIICAFNSWKWVGYNSIIYIAAITSLDAECYEAADIDGANVFQKIWYITFPSIKPTIITMLLLQVGRILRGDFEMFYQIIGSNGQLYNATDVIDTYVFRALLTNPNMGMTAAASFYQSALCFIIIMLVNNIVKRIEADYALF